MDKFEKVVSLAKRRGFVFAGSDIYGGLSNTYDYGPLGLLLLRNITNLWWKQFSDTRKDMYGIVSNVLMNPKVWEASGHTSSFTDVLIDCKSCKKRLRADHLIEDFYKNKRVDKNIQTAEPGQLKKIIEKEKISCPFCGKFDWTEPRLFNLLFETHLGIVPDKKVPVYLRGEIAQGMFVNFKNVLDSMTPKLPFGIVQSGVAFRNEITLGKFIFRTLQFNLSEFEYFFNPDKQDWKQLFEYWKGEMWTWTTKILCIEKKNLRWREHSPEERSHYSKRTEDIEYKFPYGFKELYGLAYRTDFDLKNHMKQSGVDLRYTDFDSGQKFIPHVIEPTFGMDRTFMVLLFDKYWDDEENKRVVLKLPPILAPYKVAVFPLVSNKSELVEKAKIVYEKLKPKMSTVWDDRGNIGKRYFAQDEIGTPWCVTIDYETLENQSVTIRHRDTKKQERIPLDKLIEALSDWLERAVY